MKNKKIVSFTNTLAVGICLLTGSLYAGVTVFLENNYGATINYKISQQESEGQYVGNNVRVQLGDIDFIPALLIRTTGRGSSYVSSYYSLAYYLIDIKNQQARHSNDDAVIIIGPSSSYSLTWNLDLRWEPKGSIKSFKYEEFIEPKKQPSTTEQLPVQPIPTPRVEESIKEIEREEAVMAETTADGRLNQIKNGALGSEYARKATEICSADYSQAKRLGKINLCDKLKRDLVAPVYRVDTRAKKKPEFVSPDLAPAIKDIKNSIDLLHRSLAGYKSRGEAS